MHCVFGLIIFPIGALNKSFHILKYKTSTYLRTFWRQFFFFENKKQERKKERKKEKFNFNNCTNEHVIHDCFKLNVQIQQEDIKDVNFIVFTKPTKFRLSVQIDTDYEYLSSIKVCSISDEDVFLNFVLQFFLFFLKE